MLCLQNILVCNDTTSHDRTMLFFFFQAEDGIRDLTVTGVQTCALPIFVELPIRGGAGARRTSTGRATPRGAQSQAREPRHDTGFHDQSAGDELAGAARDRKSVE